jgi:hypothetical protein
MHWNEVLTVFAVIATNLGTVIALYIQTDKKIDENRKETDNKIEVFRVETRAMITAIQQEMKDFHGRLCAIEERNRK